MQESFTISGLIKFKKYSEGHFTWCNKGKKFPFYTLFILGERIKLIFDLFVQEFETLAFVKRHWKILSCNAFFFFFAQKKTTTEFVLPFLGLTDDSRMSCQVGPKNMSFIYISFLLHVRDVKFHELWTELRKTFFDASHINNFDSRLDYAKS